MAYIRKSKGKLQDNPLFAGVSGALGKSMVVKQYKNMVVLANIPRKTRFKPTEEQKAKRLLFQEAVHFAKKILGNPKQKAAYARKSKGKRNAFQAAMSEYLTSHK